MKTGNLQALYKRGLINAGLVELTPTLLARYNECLQSVGIPPTDCKKIHVDGVGWSPEIARERRNPYYLCVGGIINPIAIIVSPDQYKKPVYWPIFSWMRGAMRVVFEKYHREIYDITGTHVISLDCENGLSSLQGPADLLLLSTITMRPTTGSLGEAAQEQATLIADFNAGLRCLKNSVRARLVEHRIAHGDLRKRRVAMQPVAFDLFQDFYTVAFGGAFVLRDVDGSDMLILESQNEFESIKGSNVNAVTFYLHDATDSPSPYLENAGFLRIPIREFKENPKILEEKKDLLVSLSLCDCEEGIDWNAVSMAKRKSLIKKHAARVPPLYAELERFAAAVQLGRGEYDISSELWHFLAVPSERMPPSVKEVLWILLTHKEPRRLLNLYRYNKNKFLEVFGEWSEAKQEWVAGYVKARYEPIMNRQ